VFNAVYLGMSVCHKHSILKMVAVPLVSRGNIKKSDLEGGGSVVPWRHPPVYQFKWCVCYHRRPESLSSPPWAP